MRILLIVDVQRDFIDGSLAVPDSFFLAQPISMMSEDYDLVIATMDWHPANHISFIPQGGIHPVHCVESTQGASLDFYINQCADVIIRKGTDSKKEAYSGFEGTILANLLYDLNFEDLEIDVVGLATEYCIKATVLDGLRMGLRMRVLQKFIRGIDPIDANKALLEMQEAGAKIEPHIPA